MTFKNKDPNSLDGFFNKKLEFADFIYPCRNRNITLKDSGNDTITLDGRKFTSYKKGLDYINSGEYKRRWGRLLSHPCSKLGIVFKEYSNYNVSMDGIVYHSHKAALKYIRHIIEKKQNPSGASPDRQPTQDSNVDIKGLTQMLPKI